MKRQLLIWRARLAFRRRRWHYWQKRHNTSEMAKWQRLANQAQHETQRIEKEIHFKKHGSWVMYDTTTPRAVPNNPEAVAGYVDGKYNDFAQIVEEHPHAKHLSITVFGGAADCLDIEPGNPILPSQAPKWVRDRHTEGRSKPVLYADASEMPEVIRALSQDSISRNQYRVWTAHYTGKPHIEPGSDATQWTDEALGRNLDESLCVADFFS